MVKRKKSIRMKSIQYAAAIPLPHSSMTPRLNTYNKDANMHNHFNELMTHEERSRYMSSLDGKNFPEFEKTMYNKPANNTLKQQTGVMTTLDGKDLNYYEDAMYDAEKLLANKNVNTFHEVSIQNMSGKKLHDRYNEIHTTKERDDFIKSLKGDKLTIFQEALINSISTASGLRKKKRSTRHKKKRGKKTRKYRRKY